MATRRQFLYAGGVAALAAGVLPRLFDTRAVAAQAKEKGGRKACPRDCGLDAAAPAPVQVSTEPVAPAIEAEAPSVAPTRETP